MVFLIAVLFASASASGQTSIDQNNLIQNGGFDEGGANWSTSANGVYFYTTTVGQETDSILSIGYSNDNSFWQQTPAVIEPATDYILTIRALVGQSPLTGVNLSFQDVTTGWTWLTNQTFNFPDQTETWRIFSLYVSSNLLTAQVGDTIGVGGQIFESPSSQEGWLWVDWMQLAPAVPQFTIQPQNVTNYAGAAASISALAIGGVTNFTGPAAGLLYQWYQSPATPIAGATNATLFFGSLNSTNAGVYYVVATGAYGSCPSSNATLVVLPAPGPGTPIFVNTNQVLVPDFQGWGTSLCWWANVIGGYSNRDSYADLIFSQLKLNIVRYNIGGGENPAITNTALATNPNDWRAQMQGFEPTNGVWDWNADANQRYILRAAVARGVDHVEAFNNSPPWWMTVSGSVTGATNTGGNNLQTNEEQSFAFYLANVVSNLTLLDNIHFDTVTPMNEPNEGWWVYGEGQEGCNMSTPQQIRVVNDLSAQLKVSGLTAAIAACDDSFEADTVTSLGQYGSALTNVSRFTTHTYSANNPSGLYELALTNDKPLWVTEYGDGDATGMTMARRIHDDLTQMMPSAWVYWQVVDETGTGWGPLENPLLPSTNSGFTSNYTITQKFYVLGQFTEFIRPGSELLGIADTNTLAAYNPGASTLVIVTVNNTTNSYYVTYGLTNFGGLPTQAEVYRTSTYEGLAPLPPLAVSNHQLTSYIFADAVTTFVLSNAVAGVLTLTQDITPLSANLYAGLSNQFTAQASGATPISYSWLLNGTAIAGATNSSYNFAVLPGSNAYQCLITNSQGAVTSSMASVIGLTPPRNAFSLGLIADGPLAYWRLNEAAGTSVAYDYIGGHNGVYGTNTTSGLPGVPSPPFLGFQNELAAGMNNSVKTVGAGYVTTAGLDLATNTATFLCWVFPYTAQTNPSGLVFLRSGANVFGSQIGGGDALDYTWGNNAQTYDYGSGLVVPTNQWSMVALTITPSNAILYVFNTNGWGSATNNVANPPQSFAGGFALGADPQTSTLPDRIFNGKMDEVALFDYTLSASQLNQIYSLATGGLNVTIKHPGGQIVVSWPFGTLEQANSLMGPWAPVTAASSPYTNAPGANQVFYRLLATPP